MSAPGKLVLQSLSGYRPELDALVSKWIAEGVKYIGVIGADAARIEEIVDELCVGDGSNPYFMLTASHGPEESLDDAIRLADLVTEVDGISLGPTVDVVRF